MILVHWLWCRTDRAHNPMHLIHCYDTRSDMEDDSNPSNRSRNWQSDSDWYHTILITDITLYLILVKWSNVWGHCARCLMSCEFTGTYYTLALSFSNLQLWLSFCLRILDSDPIEHTKDCHHSGFTLITCRYSIHNWYIPDVDEAPIVTLSVAISILTPTDCI